MKNVPKKILSVILAVIMIISVAPAAFATVSKDGNNYPVLSVLGRQKLANPIYNSDGEQLYPLADGTFTKDTILKSVKECLPYLTKGMASGDYSEWVEKVTEIFTEIYSPIVPDENGDLPEGTYVNIEDGLTDEFDYTWEPQIDYLFDYDWRKDTYDVVDQLHSYIEMIKEARHCDKIIVTARCYGANLILAYIDKYGCDDIETLTLQASLAEGAKMIGSLFSGDVSLNTENVETYLKSLEDFSLGDDQLDEFVMLFLEFINSAKQLSISDSALNSLINKLYKEAAPSVLRSTLGRVCCYMNCVDSEHYEQAKEFIFGGCEDQYKWLLDSTDKYHYEVMDKAVEIIQNSMNSGMKFANIVKYNFANYPLMDDYETCDKTVEVSRASFGAVAADYGKTLTSSQLANSDMKYVTEDYIIDATNCPFRDYTWFVKDYEHSTFWQMTAYIDKINQCEEQPTIFTVDGVPRTLAYDEETDYVWPYTADETETETVTEDDTTPFLSAIKRFIFALDNFIEFIKNWLNTNIFKTAA